MQEAAATVRLFPTLKQEEVENENDPMGNFTSKRCTEMKTSRKLAKSPVCSKSAVALSLIVMLGTSMTASSDEADAKRLLKGMSDYMAAQKAISFEYDATLEVVTKEKQKLALASSGTLTLNAQAAFRTWCRPKSRNYK